MFEQHRTLLPTLLRAVAHRNFAPLDSVSQTALAGPEQLLTEKIEITQRELLYASSYLLTASYLAVGQE